MENDSNPDILNFFHFYILNNGKAPPLFTPFPEVAVEHISQYLNDKWILAVLFITKAYTAPLTLKKHFPAQYSSWFT